MKFKVSVSFQNLFQQHYFLLTFLKSINSTQHNSKQNFIIKHKRKNFSTALIILELIWSKAKSVQHLQTLMESDWDLCILLERMKLLQPKTISSENPFLPEQEGLLSHPEIRESNQD
jgi:hypothetical protein